MTHKPLNAKKVFGELSEFKIRNVELYRSQNVNKTAIYFTDVSDEKLESASAYFEILRFDYDYGFGQTYIRYPNTNYFVEAIDTGSSSQGCMQHVTCQDVWQPSYLKLFQIYSDGQNMLYANGIQHNFMKKIASYDKGNPYCTPYPNETKENYEELQEILKLKYLKLPQDIRRIHDCCKTKDENPIYYVVDSAAFTHGDQRFFVVQNGIAKQYEIKKYSVARDGGTTWITVIDENGKEHMFFSPTHLPEKVLCEKFDETELEVCTKEETEKLVKLLEINLVEEDEDNL